MDRYRFEVAPDGPNRDGLEQGGLEQGGLEQGGLDQGGLDQDGLEQGVDALIARVGVGLRRAYVTSRLDQATYEAAEAELAAVADRRDPLALKRLRGLVDEVPELVEQIRVIGRRW